MTAVTFDLRSNDITTPSRDHCTLRRRERNAIRALKSRKFVVIKRFWIPGKQCDYHALRKPSSGPGDGLTVVGNDRRWRLFSIVNATLRRARASPRERPRSRIVFGSSVKARKLLTETLSFSHLREHLNFYPLLIQSVMFRDIYIYIISVTDRCFCSTFICRPTRIQIENNELHHVDFLITSRKI